MDTSTLGGGEMCRQVREQRCGKLSGGNSRIRDSDVQERRLGNRFGGNDLKEEGVMEEE